MHTRTERHTITKPKSLEKLKKRETAPNKLNISFTTSEIKNVIELSELFAKRYSSEIPYSFSRTISECIEITRSHYKSYFEFVSDSCPPRIGIATERKSVTVTDKDLVMLKELELRFNEIYPLDVPFTYSKIIAKCIWFSKFY